MVIQDFANKRVFLDTAPLIYFMEGHTAYQPVLSALFDFIDQAAALREQYQLKTPDAIQLATAVAAQADYFLTNDGLLKKVRELQVVTLDQLA